MDRALATSLIRPLAVGQATPGGWTLESIEIERSEDRNGYRFAVYGFSSPRLQLLLRPSAFGGNAAAQSRNFMVSIRDEGGVFQSVGEEGFRDFVSFVQANDTADYDPAEPMAAAISNAEGRSSRDGPTVYVVPGHIGSLYDLSFRAIRILQDVPVILTEAGNGLDLQTIDEHFQIGLQGKTLVEFDRIGPAELERFSDLLETGRDLCLFGASEGLPTVCDPGWKAIDYFQGRGVAIHTLAGGGALAAALMRRGNNWPFSFWGVLDRDDGNLVLPHLADAAARGTRDLPTAICFGHSESLAAAWPDFGEVLAGFEGRIRFMFDLTRADEGERVVELADLPTFDPLSLGPNRKLVILLEVQPRRRSLPGRVLRRVLYGFRRTTDN